MSNQGIEMQQVRKLIAIWMSEIRLNNYDSYYDINKVGEHLSRQLLNLLYDYQLEDLNKVKTNFPGLDIGDTTKALVAYQVTSRTDSKKVIENLELVVKNNFHKTFNAGIRFLILNDTKKISFSAKAKKKPNGVLSSFQITDDIIYPENLIKKIEDIYEEEADLIKFNQIKILLEKQIIPIISQKPIPDDKLDKLTSLLSQALNKFSDKGQTELEISNHFFLAILSRLQLQ